MTYLKLFARFTLAALALLTVLSAQADAVPPGSDDEIRARLEPFGSLCRAGEDCGTAAATADSGPKSGEEVYSQFCFACHATGVSGAPLLGDAAAWAPRVDKGMDVLMTSTLNGLNLMPPKGTCMGCSDDELQAAVTYMVEQTQ
ncbi:MAG TPA: c-type cytochrome [Pseudomonadales bacterium]